MNKDEHINEILEEMLNNIMIENWNIIPKGVLYSHRRIVKMG